MVKVVLETLWVTSLEDPTDSTSFPFMVSFSRAVAAQGDRRTYGNGRQRLFLGPGRPATWVADLPACTAAQVAWLEERVGRTMFWRDDRGHGINGAYLSVDASEDPYSTDGDLSLTVLELTV